MKKLSCEDPEIILQERSFHVSIWQCASEAKNEHALWSLIILLRIYLNKN